MLHHPSGSARGQASDIQNEARELMRLRDYVNNVLSIATGQPVERVRAAGGDAGAPTTYIFIICFIFIMYGIFY